MSTADTNAGSRSRFGSQAAVLVLGIALGLIAATWGTRLAGQPAQAEPARVEIAKPVPKWEYKVVDIETVKFEAVEKTGEGPTPENYAKRLTDEGKDGWELFSWNYPFVIYRRAK
jgi:hypothetical protein